VAPIRSALFVPGHRAAWIEKAAKYGADRIILDLEDSVPAAEKVAARAITKAGLKTLGRADVRVNNLDDVPAILCPELSGIILPKVETAGQLQALDRLLTDLGDTKIETPLLCETALAMRNIYEIATACKRVHRVILAAGPGGDAARAIGYQWSKEGIETLYLRSKCVLDCRAAGIHYPEITSWWNIPDLAAIASLAFADKPSCTLRT
jgi:citrate lyase subunit beta/citryl-CoA lyase